MLSYYTWGQFCLFALVLLVVYYAVVGFLYYRDELAALLRGKRLARGPALAAAGAPAALVRTASAFAVTPASAAAAPLTDETAGAADNLPEPAAPLVAGTLPDSTAAKGSDAGAAETAAPLDADVTSAAEQAEQHLDESRPDEELDEADRALAALIRQAAAPTAPAEEALAAGPPTGEPGQPAGPAVALAGSLADVALEGDLVYQPAVADDTDLFAAFAEPLASPLAIRPAELELLVEADSLAAFLAQVQRGHKPVVPAELRGTSLVGEMADLLVQSNHELMALFGQEV